MFLVVLYVVTAGDFFLSRWFMLLQLICFSCWFMLLFVVHVVSTADISVGGLVAADCLIVGLLCCCCSFFSCRSCFYCLFICCSCCLS